MNNLDRRRVTDRRSFGADRRRAERRVGAAPVVRDRRQGADRRKFHDRRTGRSRRISEAFLRLD